MPGVTLANMVNGFNMIVSQLDKVNYNRIKNKGVSGYGDMRLRERKESKASAGRVKPWTTLVGSRKSDFGFGFGFGIWISDFGNMLFSSKLKIREKKRREKTILTVSAGLNVSLDIRVQMLLIITPC